MSLFKAHFPIRSPLSIQGLARMCFLLLLLLFYGSGGMAGETRCITKDCHDGIMDIVPETLPMMQLIKQNG